MITGLLPAGGKAARIHGIPKYLLPVDGGTLAARHIAQMRSAGADNIWLGVPKAHGPLCSDLHATVNNKLETSTMCEMLLATRKYYGEDTILFGMPDTYWQDECVYDLLLNRIQTFGADAAVGVWRVRPDQRGKLGLVDWQGEQLVEVVDKDPTSDLDYAWGALAWASSFWPYIQPDMAHIGLALSAAVQDRLRVMVVPIQGDYYDCGTPDEYFRLCARFAEVTLYG